MTGSTLLNGFDQQSYAGYRIEIVEAGTSITDERTGQTENVPESGAVFAGNRCYCTKATAARLQQEFQRARGTYDRR